MFCQTLHEGRFFGLDHSEAGIKLCYPLACCSSFGSAPSLFNFQARDLYVRPLGNKEAVHSTGKRTNGPQTPNRYRHKCAPFTP